MSDLLINQQKTQNNVTLPTKPCAILLFFIFCALTSFTASSLAGIYAINEASGPIHSFDNSPPPIENCTTWKYDGGFWPPQRWPAVTGHCLCQRGWGCHCYIQGCGKYEDYNYWFNVVSWLLTVSIVISSGLAVMFLMWLAFSIMID